MARRKCKRTTGADGTKVAKALRDAIVIVDEALDQLKVRTVKPKRPKRKH